MTATNGRPNAPRPAAHPAEPPPPLIAPTGDTTLDVMGDVINTAALPFRQAPPPEQGAAGVVAQGLGGVLGLVGAPAQVIDAGIASITAPIAALFPSLPAATLLDMHVGTPHAHLHPPSLIPPAPPVPLPSFGVMLAAGCVSVLIGGIPAARCGDMGISITCGSLAPPFEVFTGSSNVFIGGARAARLGDITFHCNPGGGMGFFAKAMAAAGAVAGIANAVANLNEAGALEERAAQDSGADAANAAAEAAGKTLAAAMAAAQVAADAAALALTALCGKDPGVPPGIGAVVGGTPNVLIGGMPLPALGDMIMGKVYEKIGGLARRVRRRGRGHDANGTHCNAGHPVDVITGAVFDDYTDYSSEGLFAWTRHYTTARSALDGPAGRGMRHRYERTLRVRLHRCAYLDEMGRATEFPRFRRGEREVRAHGWVLRREEGRRFTLRRGDTTMHFEAPADDGDAALACIEERGRALHLERDAAGTLVAASERRPGDGARLRHELRYDRDGRVVEVLRRDGAARVVASFAYDRDGCVTEARDGEGRAERYAWGDAWRIAAWSDRRGYTFRWRYDDAGRCVWTSGDDGLWCTELTYHPERSETLVTTEPGATWTYRYDVDGTLLARVDPYGGVLTRELDGEGRVAREIDPGGRVMTWLYDADGGHRARLDRFGYELPTMTQMPRVPERLGPRLPRTARGWLVGDDLDARPSAHGRVGRFPEDVRAHIEALGGPGARGEPRTIRDACGRVTEATDVFGRRRAWRYDGAGNTVSWTDRDGRTWQRQVTSWNLPGAEIDPLGHTTRFAWSPLERLTDHVDPGGTHSHYDYDLKERLVRVTRHGAVRETYAYDVGDRLVEKRDGRDRVMLTVVPDATGFPAVRRLASGDVQRFAYDRHGRIARATNDAGDVVQARDAGARLWRDLRDGRGVTHRHDPAGSGETVTLGRYVTRYRRRSGGGMELTDPTGRRHYLETDAEGRVYCAWANGTRDVLRFDGDGRLAGRVVWRRPDDGAPRPWSVRYEYTPEGDLAATRDSERGVTTWRLDAAHRLVGEGTPDGDVLEYVLDAAGNLLRAPGRAAASYDPGNRLAAAGAERFAHDHRHHVSARLRPDGETRYTYDSMDQLVRVEDGRGEAWTAAYDALGRRARSGRGDAQTEYVWDGDRLAAERAPDGRLRVYVYASHDALSPVAFVDYARDDEAPARGRLYVVFNDQVGAPLRIEDDRGEVVWRVARVDPYGASPVAPGARIDYALRWPGHRYDAETGLQYNRFRDYDPALGRYLQSDPAGISGGANLYAYAPNPLVNVDLMGLMHSGKGDNHDTQQGPHAQPVKEGTDAHAHPPRHDDEPTAFPGLRRGGEETDEHARRVAEVTRDLAARDAEERRPHREAAARDYDAETQRRVAAAGEGGDAVAAQRARDRDADVERDATQRRHREAAERDYDADTQRRVGRKRNPDEAGRLQQSREANREANVSRETSRRVADDPPQMRDERSATVIRHEDGTVSVGMSDRSTQGDHGPRVADELNRRYPPAEGQPPTYHSSENSIPRPPADQPGHLHDAGPGNPHPGVCSEGHAAQAAGEHTTATGSRPESYQTVWTGSDGTNPHAQGDPPRRAGGDGGPTTMCPCGTCQRNGGTYRGRAGY